MPPAPLSYPPRKTANPPVPFRKRPTPGRRGFLSNHGTRCARLDRVTEAILFDFDGLVLETELPIFQAWRQVYAEFSCTLTLEEYASCIGSGHLDFNPFDDLRKKSGRTVVEAELQPRLSRIYLELIERNDALPGVRKILAEAKELGIRTAIASSSNRDWIERHLTRLGLLEEFETICSREDVARIKPAPDLYLAALRALDIGPDAAVVLEDSPNGVLAARRAGIFVVAVPGPLTCDLPLNDPDLQLKSLEDLPLAPLLDRIGERRRALNP